MSALSALFAAQQAGFTDLGNGCMVTPCLCPRGRTFFDFRGRWMATADRYPVPGSRGGGYVPHNVRLAHAHCNSVIGGHGGRNKETKKQRQAREKAEAEA